MLPEVLVKRNWLLVVYLLTFLTSTPFALSQAVFGNIAGTVTDPSGAAIVGATVTIKDTERGSEYHTSTNGQGGYEQGQLLAGVYAVEIAAPGFSSFSSTVQVHVDSTVKLDGSLKVGTGSGTVQVTDTTPLLQVDRAEISTELNTTEVDQLPLFARNATGLAFTAPGTVLGNFQVSDAENAQGGYQFASNGQQYFANGFLLDGTENNSAILGIAVINPNIDSLQELKLTTSNYDAEFGSVAGTLIQATTKSGSNSFHGTAFEYLRNTEFIAQNPFSPGSLPLHWNQFGGSVGGPILKDKLFFFADYQGTRQSSGAPVITTVPTDAERAGDLSALLAGPIPGAPLVQTTEGNFVAPQAGMVFDPTTGNSDGTGRLAVSSGGRLNVLPSVPAAITKLLANLPEPNTGGSGALVNNYVGSGTSKNQDDQEDGRIDYTLNANSRIFGRYSISQFSASAPGAFGVLAGGPALSGANFAGSSNTDNQSLALGYTRTFSPTLILEARFGTYRYKVRVQPGDVGTTPATDAGIPGLNMGTDATSGMPAFYVNGNAGFEFGYSLAINSCNCPLSETENHFQWVNNWTKIVGTHTIGWGADIRRAQQTRIPSDSHRSGEITFEPATTGNYTADLAGQNAGLTTGSGMASLLFGVPESFARYFTGSGLRPGLRQTRMFLYAQDNWRATPRLTISYGLRYENYLPQNAAYPGGAGSFDPATGNLLVAGVAPVSKSMNVTAYNWGFTPRIGVAYQLRPSTVIRAGYGSSFTPAGLGAVFGQAPDYDPPILLPQQLNPSTPYASVYNLYAGPPLPTLPTGNSGAIPLPNDLGVYYWFDPPNKYRVPLAEFWNAAVQHQITPTMSIEAAYVGNVGRHIYVNANLNQAVPGPGALFPRERFYPSFGLTQGLYSICNCDNSNYHSLQMKWVDHQAKGLDFIVSYTYSKALDDTELGGVFDNNLDYFADYGPASFDRRHILTVSNVWKLPFGRGQQFGSNVNRVVDLIAGGWQFDGITQATSGIPFTANVANAPLLNTNFNSVRPDQVGNPHVAHPDRSEWFNPAAFVEPQGLYRDGDTGRNSLVGPLLFTMNLSLAKVFTIAHEKTIEFRWENYNALNHVNLGTPANLVDEANAGQITSLLPGVSMRQMQFGLHLRF
jgi:hypothetical protein